MSLGKHYRVLQNYLNTALEMFEFGTRVMFWWCKIKAARMTFLYDCVKTPQATELRRSWRMEKPMCGLSLSPLITLSHPHTQQWASFPAVWCFLHRSVLGTSWVKLIKEYSGEVKPSDLSNEYRQRYRLLRTEPKKKKSYSDNKHIFRRKCEWCLPMQNYLLLSDTRLF